MAASLATKCRRALNGAAREPCFRALTTIYLQGETPTGRAGERWVVRGQRKQRAGATVYKPQIETAKARGPSPGSIHWSPGKKALAAAAQGRGPALAGLGETTVAQELGLRLGLLAGFGLTVLGLAWALGPRKNA